MIRRPTVKQSRLDLAPHEAIFKVVVYDIARGRLHRQDPDVHLLVRAPSFGIGLGDAQQIARRRGARARARRRRRHILHFIDVGAFGVQIRELAGERRVSIVTGGFQGRRLQLTDDANLVSRIDEAFHVHMQPMDRDAGRRKAVQMGFGRILYASTSTVIGMNDGTYVRHI